MKKKKFKIVDLKVESFSMADLGKLKGGTNNSGTKDTTPTLPDLPLPHSIDTSNSCCSQNDNS